MTAILHLTTASAWAAAQAAGVIVPPSLRTEGFVHCSTGAQIDGVVERFYAGVGDLVVVAIDPVALGDALRWEPPAHPDGSVTADEESAVRFPHVYAPIPISAVTAVAPYRPGAWL